MDWDLAAERTIKDMENMHPPNIEDEHDMTDRATYSTVVKSLLDNSHVRYLTYF
jgi:hypothetical protein